MKEESNNPNKNNPEELPKNVSDDIKKTEEYGRNIVKFENELKSDPKYREYFKQYNESSWTGFVKQYAFKKALCLRFGDSYVKKLEKRELKYYNEAEKSLWYIQQKKLFNLQCEWRAEKITLPNVELTVDFLYWGKHIKTCPFLEPITEEEFQWFVDYFTDPHYDTEYEDFIMYTAWQDYYTFKRELSADPDSDQAISYPEWYFFYDSRMGTSELINLPDIRGDKESFYLKLWREDWSKKNPPKPNPNFDRRPSFNYFDENIIEDFVKTFEDKTIKKYYNAYNKLHPRHDEENIDHILFELQEIKEPVAIDYNANWKEAIKIAYRKHEHQKTAEQLENVFRDYQSKIKMGIGFSEEEEKYDFKGLCEADRKHIIEARVLNGEPADLNF